MLIPVQLMSELQFGKTLIPDLPIPGLSLLELLQNAALMSEDENDEALGKANTCTAGAVVVAMTEVAYLVQVLEEDRTGEQWS